MTLCSIWIALEPATEMNGCMRCEPGGHIRGPLLHAGEGDHMHIPHDMCHPDEMASLPMAAGRPTAHSLHTHCTITARSLHAHCTPTAHSLHTHCTLTAHSLHTHCTLTARSLHANCTLTVHSLHTHCTLTAHSLHTHCTLAALTALTAHSLHSLYNRGRTTLPLSRAALHCG
jgi:hypothetical protein